MNAPALIDREVLEDLFATIGDDGGRAVLELFMGESGTYLAAMAEGLAQGDAGLDRVRRTAHSLKSGAGQVGAAALSAASAAVERLSAEGAPGLAEAVAALRSCTAETVAALHTVLAGKG